MNRYIARPYACCSSMRRASSGWARSLWRMYAVRGARRIRFAWYRVVDMGGVPSSARSALLLALLALVPPHLGDDRLAARRIPLERHEDRSFELFPSGLAERR